MTRRAGWGKADVWLLSVRRGVSSAGIIIRGWQYQLGWEPRIAPVKKISYKWSRYLQNDRIRHLTKVLH